MNLFALTDSITLNNGISMPRLGLGLYRTTAGIETEDAVARALAIGYRHFDTAAIYGNEASVGQAIRHSNIPRREIFITTKVWNSDQGYTNTLRAFERSLRALNINYIDQYLIHFPVTEARKETWRALEEIIRNHPCASIGVSNYMPQHLHELLNHCSIVPAVNQIELHPFCYRYRAEVIKICQQAKITVVAYSPLTKGRRLDHPLLLSLSKKYHKSPAQLLIRWALQADLVVIPKSSKPERILENTEIFDFEIAEEDFSQLLNLDEQLITAWDPTNTP